MKEVLAKQTEDLAFLKREQQERRKEIEEIKKSIAQLAQSLLQLSQREDVGTLQETEGFLFLCTKQWFFVFINSNFERNKQTQISNLTNIKQTGCRQL